MSEAIYTPIQVAEKLSVSKGTVFRYIRSGKLKSFRMGQLRRISESALNEFIANCENGDAA